MGEPPLRHIYLVWNEEQIYELTNEESIKVYSVLMGRNFCIGEISVPHPGASLVCDGQFEAIDYDICRTDGSDSVLPDSRWSHWQSDFEAAAKAYGTMIHPAFNEYVKHQIEQLSVLGPVKK
jgi:hypothetical protein